LVFKLNGAVMKKIDAPWAGLVCFLGLGMIVDFSVGGGGFLAVLCRWNGTLRIYKKLESIKHGGFLGLRFK
jgi:hypothetical protein